MKTKLSEVYRHLIRFMVQREHLFLTPQEHHCRDGWMVLGLLGLLIGTLTTSTSLAQSSSTAKFEKAEEITLTVPRPSIISRIDAADRSKDDPDFTGPQPPSEDEFFIRTGDQLACATAGSANYLRQNNLTYVPISRFNIVQEIDRVIRGAGRSTQTEVTNRQTTTDTSGFDPVNIRFSLVAWTTAESIDQQQKLSPPTKFAYYDKHRRIRDGSIRDWIKKTKPDIPGYNSGIYPTRINYNSHTISNLQRKYIKFFKEIKSKYDSVSGDTENSNFPLQVNNPGDYPTVLPPLKSRVYAIAYDNEVDSYGGHAHLKCAFDSSNVLADELAEDLKYLKNECSKDEEKNAEPTSPQEERDIAIDNKKLLEAYFKGIYEGNPEWTGEDWQNPNNHETNKDVRLLYSTHYAVQSCLTYAENDGSPDEDNRLTAPEVLKRLRAYTDFRPEGSKKLGDLNKQDEDRVFREFDKKFFDRKFNIPKQELDKLKYTTVFGGFAEIIDRKLYHNISYFNLSNPYSDAPCKPNQPDDPCGDTSTQNNIDDPNPIDKKTKKAQKIINQRYNFLSSGFKEFLHSKRSCYHFRSHLFDLLKRERVHMPNLIAYAPKWWEHTDLGTTCQLLSNLLSDQDDLRFKNDLSTPLNRSKARKTLRTISNALKITARLEHLENELDKKGPNKNYICSPAAKTAKVKDNNDPEWHRMISSAVLDAYQPVPSKEEITPLTIFSSMHPSADYSFNSVEQKLMHLDPRYSTFFTSRPRSTIEDRTSAGLPMILSPGMTYEDYVPYIANSEGNRQGISVYAYPLSICELIDIRIIRTRHY